MMSKPLSSALAALGLATAALMLPVAAQAAPVQVNFTLTPDFGPVTAAASGSFVYDDAQVPSASPFGDQLYALTSFTLDIDGLTVVLGDFDEAFAVFGPSGFIGLAATVAGLLTLSPAVDPLGAFFAYANGAGETIGGITYDVVQATVDEPGAALLAGLALAALALSRRRS